ncbi:phosphatidylserine decarboxylase-domain-containing protein [Endogone sp. FLAS-F59071]|nr:phosphatidylserine decarboxylase-domain-containing protein [Endogone sp. FLAS-F59071]|eukprot:RUS19850.1 phosphatidylserine decarboxylase-domain-containing protein [Endogone sp. FLAS-F59071]
MVKLLENLFVLNERVVLNGRWQYGFFSMIPVGATNVGSIKINFDEPTLPVSTRPNPDHISSSHRLSAPTKKSNSLESTNPSLGGKPLVAGEEMGGFCLGSTVVLVFEAPLDFKFKVEAGQKTQMGQALGEVAVA